jgi:hypothetical protein
MNAIELLSQLLDSNQPSSPKDEESDSEGKEKTLDEGVSLRDQLVHESDSSPLFHLVAPTSRENTALLLQKLFADALKK